MQVTDHLLGIREALAALETYAARAGLDAEVPTAPGWTVHDLLAHQGEVLRWVGSLLEGRAPADRDAVHALGLAAADPVEWVQQGGLDLLQVVRDAPSDVVAPVLFAGSATPLEFWTRRICHELTIHSVDGLAASLGRRPRAVETRVPEQLALDGIDELLGAAVETGLAPRPDQPQSVVLRPEGSRRRWWLRLGPAEPELRRDHDVAADVVVEAGAVALYLSVWNRSDELYDPGTDAFWAPWRRSVRLARG